MKIPTNLQAHKLSFALATPKVESQRLHRALELSMREVGFLKQFPILLMPAEDGELRILDGRHRLVAAKNAGVKPVFKVLDTQSQPHARDISVSGNLIRRKLTITAATAAAMRVYPEKTREQIRELLGGENASKSAQSDLAVVRKHGCYVNGREYSGTEAVTAVAELTLALKPAYKSALTRNRVAKAKEVGEARKPVRTQLFHLPQKEAERLTFFAELSGIKPDTALRLSVQAWIRQQAKIAGIPLNGKS